MNSVSYDVTRLPSVLTVGRQTETGVMAVRIDCTGWLTFWPGLTLRLFVTPPGGSAAYPAKTHMEGKVLVWDVHSADTQTAGKGTLEVVGEAPGKRKLSAITATNVLRTTTATTAEPPEEIRTWFDEVTEKVEDADAALTAAKVATANANAAANRALSVAADMDAATPAVVQSTSGDVVAMIDSADRKLRRVMLYGKTTQDGTPAPDAPVNLVSLAESGSVEISVNGANLLDITRLESSASAEVSVLGNKLTLTAKTEGTYRQTKRIKILTASSPVVVQASWALVSRSNESHKPVCTGYWYKDNVQLKSESFMVWPTTTVSKTVTPPVAGAELHIIFTLNERTSAAVGDTCTLKNISICAKGGLLQYTPFVPAQTATVEVANGLPGLPVSSGGNYTDANGQQWIADSVEYDAETGAGKRVQRVAQIDEYAGEAITGAYLSTTGELSEGATVIYALPDPVETVLTAVDLAALRTNYPRTIIYNSAGAHMAVEYVTDTKTYIDNLVASAVAVALANQ